MKDINLDVELSGLKDFEKANVILSLYALVSYDEGYRKGLLEIRKQHQSIKIKKRSNKRIQYEPSKEESLKLTKMVQERINSKKQRQHRTNYCHENNIPDDEESFVISITIHSFFEAGYTNIVLNTENMFKEIHPDDSKKALSMSKFFDEVFSEIIK